MSANCQEVSATTESSSLSFTSNDIATLLGLELVGAPDVQIMGVASLKAAGAHDLAFCMDNKYVAELKTSAAGLVITTPEFSQYVNGAALLADNPEFIFAKCAAFFKQHNKPQPGIHPTAVIGEGCIIAADATIGPHCVIGNNVKIGAESVLHSSVCVYDEVIIGARAEIFSGVVIGADGFGFTQHEGEWMPVPQLGTVIIGDDVSIGALTAIDRGALENTIIEDGVKIDNHVQIAHNVCIGAHTVIAGCTGIAGSSKIGRGCMIGGGVGIADHITIADGVMLAGGARVTQDLEKGIYASPAVTVLTDIATSRRLRVHIKKLISYVKRLTKLERLFDENNSN